MIAKSDKKRQELRIEQENAIGFLLQGLSDREVAEKVGVVRQVVCKWRNHDAVFLAELNAQRQAVWESGLEKLRSLVSDAAGELEAGLQSEDEKVRQAAAIHVLRAVGLYGLDLTPKGATDPDDVEREWAKDERMKQLLASF